MNSTMASEAAVSPMPARHHGVGGGAPAQLPHFGLEYVGVGRGR
ncbi:MAG: hypothetical protein Q8N44_11185 [Rubrivivax sp.]|nr:hypothetical protein [Rubrivivax sp.]MDP3084237.1 hypothetical protein [Rubrivivax sp.]